jgi:hypothetical protein
MPVVAIGVSDTTDTADPCGPLLFYLLIITESRVKPKKYTPQKVGIIVLRAFNPKRSSINKSPL